MIRLTTVTFVALSLVAAVVAAAPSPDTDYDIMVRGVELRPGVLIDIRVKVFVNEDHPCNGRTHFAVHGGLHAASTWAPLAEAMFSDNPSGPPACRVAAIDLPGRGGSGLPSNLTLGELLLDDQVTAILATLEALIDDGMHVRTIVGQSQGALLVQMAQQRLVDDGSSLWQTYAIRKVILLAPAAPAAVPWFLADGPLGAFLVSLFTVNNSPPLGDLIVFDDLTWIDFNFTALCCGLATSAPTTAEVTLAGYNAAEPLAATLQILGLPPYSRPAVEAEVFGPDSGTELFVIGFSEDSTVLFFETAMTYAHLTGDAAQKRFVLVTDPEAVHATHVSDPRLLLEQAASTVRF